jgi:toxin YhaV
MMSELTCGEWEIYFHPQLFGQQYRELFDRVTSLKATLSPEEFKTHPTVKLFAAINIGI